ncbi:MAG: DUF5752 family protein [Candidatus Methylomirabilales bacterium]
MSEDPAVREVANTSFEFVGCVELRELLGKKAEDELQLMDLLEEVPIDSIYYHTHEYLLRHRYLMGPYPNDFATWVAIQVRDRVLGERLGVIDPCDFETLEELRDALIAVIEDHLSKIYFVPRVEYGQPFYFMQSRTVEVPTEIIAQDLQEFRDGLATVDASAIYYHFYAARIRRNRRSGDFTVWVEEALQMPELAQRIRAIDPYIFSLEQLRSRLVEACDKFLMQDGRAGAGSS